MFVCIIRCRQCVPCLLLSMEKNILVCIMCVVFEQFLESSLQRCTLVTGMKLIFVLLLISLFRFFFYFFMFLFLFFYFVCVQ